MSSPFMQNFGINHRDGVLESCNVKFSTYWALKWLVGPSTDWPLHRLYLLSLCVSLSLYVCLSVCLSLELWTQTIEISFCSVYFDSTHKTTNTNKNNWAQTRAILSNRRLLVEGCEFRGLLLPFYPKSFHMNDTINRLIIYIYGYPGYLKITT